MNETKRIKKLEDTVINRIAAGEVIQRPVNALKEMIENSIDAKSTNIQVIVNNGGMKLMQIIDNGVGINLDDFEILCERFTTSKLEKFEDLTSINTYGFRGEALASISHVAMVTIQSKIAGQDCAYKASYLDSKLRENPKPCAGNQGTIITVEDLFYNMQTRKFALRHASDELRRITDVIGKYAIHNAQISFSLKKQNGNLILKTNLNSSATDNIRIIYGDGIARELLPIEYKDETLKFTLNGLVTNTNYSSKKAIFILFINHRLVDCTPIKKNVELMYGTHLPKNSYPFIYLSLEIDPRHVDVNIHPTKHEVAFLHTEQILEKIVQTIETKLLGLNTTRTFYTQAKLFGYKSDNSKVEDQSKESSKVIQDKFLVRTDATEQKLDKFIQPDNEGNKTILNLNSSQIVVKNRRETKLTSILQLRKSIEDKCHLSLKQLFSELVFVGCCTNSTYVLIQHNTKLYVCDTEEIIQELFYQLIIFNFLNLEALHFKKPVPIKELIMIALESTESGWTEEDGPKEELAAKAVQMLTEMSAMLKDYFSLGINEQGELVHLPILIENHSPEFAGLPLYLLRLTTEVNWRHEKECFESFAKETALYYAHVEHANTIENANWKWTVEYVLYPMVKRNFYPPKSFAEKAIILQATDLPDLYKVFERC